MTSDFRSEKNLHLTMLCIGLVQVSIYYLLGATIDSTGAFAIAQPDTLLYCQAARRICEGFPFSFSAGEAVSTGTTSVLYPFVLSVPYAFGAVGKALFRAGFFLNAVFYLVFLYGWGRVIFRIFENSFTRLVAALLVALFGQTAFAALAQSDVGIWMALSALLIAALVEDRFWLYTLLLVIGPWVRPEAMMFAVAFGVVQLWRRRLDRGWIAVIAAGLSAAGVFLLNYLLTGEAQFSSVAGKGHFAVYSFPTAIHHSFNDFLAISKTLFLGLPDTIFRSMFFVPVITAVLFWTGIAVKDWRKANPAVITVFLAMFLSMSSVATSGWQGTNGDRYFAWLMPVVLVFAARGCEFLAGKLGEKRAKYLPAALIVAFTAGAAVAVAAEFRISSVHFNSTVRFAERCEATMTGKSDVAAIAECGLIYMMSPRRMHHLSGIYSPDYKVKDMTELVDLLKAVPKKDRFYYWLYAPHSDEKALGAELMNAITETIIPGPFGYELRKVNWKYFDETPTPSKAGNGKALKARVDIGRMRDEKSVDYELLTDYDLPLPKLFVAAGPVDGAEAVAETGRIVLGGEELSVPLELGKDATVVLRTMIEQTGTTPSGYAFVNRNFSFASPMELHLEVDGEEVGHVTFKLEPKGFTDAVFRIPGSAIRRSPCRVALHGDHISCGYWFYQ